MTNEEIATMMFDKLQGGKLAGVFANQGQLPSFTLIFENAEEKKGTLTFQPSIQTETRTGLATVMARIEINVTGWQK